MVYAQSEIEFQIRLVELITVLLFIFIYYIFVRGGCGELDLDAICTQIEIHSNLSHV